jgi:hypothetical protein
MATPATLEGFDFYAKTYQRYLEPIILRYNRKLQQLEPIPFKRYWLFTFHCVFVNGFIAFGSSLIVMMRYILLPHKSEESKLSILSIFYNYALDLLSFLRFPIRLCSQMES